MTSSESRSVPAQRYLGELDAALSDAPAPVRADLLADIAGELDGLGDDEARARIAELGDPRAIAADATAQVRAMNPEPAPSRAYATITGVVLTAGWCVVPLIGWIAGLVMIGVGSLWTASVRRRAILTSVAGVVVAVGLLMLFRGTDFWMVGLAAFVIVPLIVNIFVTSFLRARWGAEPRSA